MTKKRKLMPAIMFYTGDWLKDPAVRCCSLTARGLWIDMLCLMYESPIRGHLSLASGKPVDATKLARMVGGGVKEVEELLEELYECGVFSKSDDGIIFSRRMVQDEIVREQKSRAGSTGMKNRYQKDDSVITEPVTSVQQNSNTTSNSCLTPVEYENENENEYESVSNSALFSEKKSINYGWSCIPEKRQKSWGKFQRVWIIKIVENNVNPELVGLALAAYYKSSEGKGKYWRTPATLIDDEFWLEDRSLWGGNRGEIKFPDSVFDQMKIIKLYCEVSTENASKIEKRKERGDEDSSIAYNIWKKFPDILNRSNT